MSTDDDVKAEIARQEAALLRFLETGVPAEVPDVRKCILARSYGDRVRKMFPQDWDITKTGMDMDLFFPEAIEQAAESALDRFYDMEPDAFPYFDCRFEPPRPMQSQLWRLVETTTSLQTKVTLLRPYTYVYDDDHEKIALLVCEELERPLGADEDARTIRAVQLQLSALVINLNIDNVGLTTRLAQMLLTLITPLREEDLQGDAALNVNYALRFYGSTLVSRDIRGLRPFLEPKVGPWIKQTVLQIIQDLFDAEPPPPTLQWSDVTKRVVTMACALAQPDVIVNSTMISLCANAYIAAVILGLDPDLRLTKRLLACDETALEPITLSSLEETLEGWRENPKALPEQVAKLTTICAVLKSGFAKLEESAKLEPAQSSTS